MPPSEAMVVGDNIETFRPDAGSDYEQLVARLARHIDHTTDRLCADIRRDIRHSTIVLVGTIVTSNTVLAWAVRNF